MSQVDDKIILRLKHLLSELQQTKSIDDRRKVAHELRTHVESESHSRSSDTFTMLMDFINNQISDWVNGTDYNAKTTAVILMTELIDLVTEENETRMLRFGHYLRMIISNELAPVNLVNLACICLGNLSRSSGATTCTDLIISEIRRCLETIRTEKEEKWLNCWICLKTLAEYSSTIFNTYVDITLGCILPSLKSKESIRDAALSTLEQCLILIEKRGNSNRDLFLSVIFGITVDLTQSEYILCGLLVLELLLHHSPEYIYNNFDNVCSLVLKNKDHRDKHIREAGVKLFPLILQTGKCDSALTDLILNHLISLLSKTTYECTGVIVYDALSKICSILPNEIVKKLDVLSSLIQDALADTTKKLTRQHALLCLSSLISNLGYRMYHYLNPLVKLLFSFGLTPNLIIVLQNIAKHIPILLPVVQARLFNMLSSILIDSNTNTNTSSSKKSSQSGVYNTGAAILASLGLGETETSPQQQQQQQQQHETLCLALHTFSCFTFTYNFLPLIFEYVVPHLSHPETSIRKAAAKCCLALVLQHPIDTLALPIFLYNSMTSKVKTLHGLIQAQQQLLLSSTRQSVARNTISSRPTVVASPLQPPLPHPPSSSPYHTHPDGHRNTSSSISNTPNTGTTTTSTSFTPSLTALQAGEGMDKMQPIKLSAIRASIADRQENTTSTPMLKSSNAPPPGNISAIPEIGEWEDSNWEKETWEKSPWERNMHAKRGSIVASSDMVLPAPRASINHMRKSIVMMNHTGPLVNINNTNNNTNNANKSAGQTTSSSTSTTTTKPSTGTSTTTTTTTTGTTPSHLSVNIQEANDHSSSSNDNTPSHKGGEQLITPRNTSSNLKRIANVIFDQEANTDKGYTLPQTTQEKVAFLKALLDAQANALNLLHAQVHFQLELEQIVTNLSDGYNLYDFYARISKECHALEKQIGVLQLQVQQQQQLLAQLDISLDNVSLEHELFIDIFTYAKKFTPETKHLVNDSINSPEHNILDVLELYQVTCSKPLLQLIHGYTTKPTHTSRYNSTKTTSGGAPNSNISSSLLPRASTATHPSVGGSSSSTSTTTTNFIPLIYYNPRTTSVLNGDHISIASKNIMSFPRNWASMRDRILIKLLSCCNTDPDVSLRIIILQSLTSKFDKFIGQLQYVKHIVTALHDSDAMVRSLSIQILCRLSLYNSGLLVPLLRHYIIELLTKIQATVEFSSIQNTMKSTGYNYNTTSSSGGSTSGGSTSGTSTTGLHSSLSTSPPHLTSLTSGTGGTGTSSSTSSTSLGSLTHTTTTTGITSSTSTGTGVSTSTSTSASASAVAGSIGHTGMLTLPSQHTTSGNLAIGGHYYHNELRETYVTISSLEYFFATAPYLYRSFAPPALSTLMNLISLRPLPSDVTTLVIRSIGTTVSYYGRRSITLILPLLTNIIACIIHHSGSIDINARDSPILFENGILVQNILACTSANLLNILRVLITAIGWVTIPCILYPSLHTALLFFLNSSNTPARIYAAELISVIGSHPFNSTSASNSSKQVNNLDLRSFYDYISRILNTTVENERYKLLPSPDTHVFENELTLALTSIRDQERVQRQIQYPSTFGGSTEANIRRIALQRAINLYSCYNVKSHTVSNASDIHEYDINNLSEQTHKLIHHTIYLLQKLDANNSANTTLLAHANQVNSLNATNSTSLTHSELDSTVNIGLTNLSVTRVFRSIAISVLIDILYDSNRSHNHKRAIEALSFIYATITYDCVSYLNIIVPCLARCLSYNDDSIRCHALDQLCTLIAYSGSAFEPFVAITIDTILHLWPSLVPKYCHNIMLILQVISIHLSSAFDAAITNILPLLLHTLSTDTSQERITSQLIILCCTRLCKRLDICLHLLIPEYISLLRVENTSTPIYLRALLLYNTSVLLTHHIATEYCEMIIQPLLLLLQNVDTLAAQIVTNNTLYNSSNPNATATSTSASGSGASSSSKFAGLTNTKSVTSPSISKFSTNANNTSITPPTTASITAANTACSLIPSTLITPVYITNIPMPSQVNLLIEHILYTLCVIITKTGRSFLPYMPNTLKIVQNNPKFANFTYTNTITDTCVMILDQTNTDTTVSIKPITYWSELGVLIPNDLQNTVKHSTTLASTSGSSGSGSGVNSAAQPQSLKLAMSQEILVKTWDIGQRVGSEEWLEWLRNVAVQFLKESPSPPLRACSAVAQKDHVLAKKILPVAFASCWSEFIDVHQDAIISSISTALQSPTAPNEVIVTLLNLLDFMSRSGNDLPFDIRLLANLSATKCYSYARALYLKECDFHDVADPSNIFEDLVAMYSRLNQPQAAIGMLAIAPRYNLKVQEAWFEQLCHWDEALISYTSLQLTQAYDHQQTNTLSVSKVATRSRVNTRGSINGSIHNHVPIHLLNAISKNDTDHNTSNALYTRQGVDVEVVLGRLRCLKAMSEHKKVSLLAEHLFQDILSTYFDDNEPINPNPSFVTHLSSVLHDISVFAVHAHHVLGQWDQIKPYLPFLNINTFDAAFYKAIYHVYMNNLSEAETHVTLARELVQLELSKIVSDAGSRTFPSIVGFQLVNLLHDIIVYKKLAPLANFNTTIDDMTTTTYQLTSRVKHTAALSPVHQEMVHATRDLLHTQRGVTVQPHHTNRPLPHHGHGPNKNMQVLEHTQDDVLAASIEQAYQRAIMRECWSKQLESLDETPSVWCHAISLQSLVLTPIQNTHSLLAYSGVLLKHKRYDASLHVIEKLFTRPLHEPPAPYHTHANIIQSNINKLYNVEDMCALNPNMPLPKQILYQPSIYTFAAALQQRREKDLVGDGVYDLNTICNIKTQTHVGSSNQHMKNTAMYTFSNLLQNTVACALAVSAQSPLPIQPQPVMNIEYNLLSNYMGCAAGPVHIQDLGIGFDGLSFHCNYDDAPDMAVGLVALSPFALAMQQYEVNSIVNNMDINTGGAATTSSGTGNNSTAMVNATNTMEDLENDTNLTSLEQYYAINQIDTTPYTSYPCISDDPCVAVGIAQHLWYVGQRTDALHRLHYVLSYIEFLLSTKPQTHHANNHCVHSYPTTEYNHHHPHSTFYVKHHPYCKHNRTPPNPQDYHYKTASHSVLHTGKTAHSSDEKQAHSSNNSIDEHVLPDLYEDKYVPLICLLTTCPPPALKTHPTDNTYNHPDWEELAPLDEIDKTRLKKIAGKFCYLLGDWCSALLTDKAPSFGILSAQSTVINTDANENETSSSSSSTTTNTANKNNNTNSNTTNTTSATQDGLIIPDLLIQRDLHISICLDYTISAYHKSIEFTPKRYRAWHGLAGIHYRAAQILRQTKNNIKSVIDLYYDRILHLQQSKHNNNCISPPVPVMPRNTRRASQIAIATAFSNASTSTFKNTNTISLTSHGMGVGGGGAGVSAGSGKGKGGTDINTTSLEYALQEYSRLNGELYLLKTHLHYHVICAVRGFSKAIPLTIEVSETLQDTLRLLSLWFEHGTIRYMPPPPGLSYLSYCTTSFLVPAAGSNTITTVPFLPSVREVLSYCFQILNINTWVPVTPQIIARLHSESAAGPIRALIHDLLILVGRVHPQAMIYSLTVAVQSTQAKSVTVIDQHLCHLLSIRHSDVNPNVIYTTDDNSMDTSSDTNTFASISYVRNTTAVTIMNNLQSHSASLVEQAVVISTELIRVAVLWEETWQEALEEASRLWFTNMDAIGMLGVLLPLHEKIYNVTNMTSHEHVQSDHALTPHELMFIHALGREITDAHAWCLRFLKKRAKYLLESHLHIPDTHTNVQKTTHDYNASYENKAFNTVHSSTKGVVFDANTAPTIESSFHANVNTASKIIPNPDPKPSTPNDIYIGDASDINQAWEIYCQIFKELSNIIRPPNADANSMTLFLLQVSPKLLYSNNLSLAIPGTYNPSTSQDNVISIVKPLPTLTIIDSKQRPRKIGFVGSDGKIHNFLLKGHEDLRQDNRVMQLFELVNAISSSSTLSDQYGTNDINTSGSINTNTTNNTSTADDSHINSANAGDLSIRGYNVIPLSPVSGLLQWLSNCDTLHVLIKEYRVARKVLLDVENRLMNTTSPNFASCTIIQKTHSFGLAMKATTGKDLAEILWLRSNTAEKWLDRRSTYTRSLAVMSIVGYILGLGDRHPCNLMIERSSGKVIHIDFGDCFEVAMHRDKFPEKVPFRLTRMLVRAMEVSGVEGTYRLTCEHVMGKLRNHHESVMAVLEAFIYDPLITWRLLTEHERATDVIPNEEKMDENMESMDYGNNTDPDATANANANEDDINARPTNVTNIHAQVHLNLDTNTTTPLPTVQGIDLYRVQDAYEQSSTILNAKALSVIKRVEAKLHGRDFDLSLPVNKPPNMVLDELNVANRIRGFVVPGETPAPAITQLDVETQVNRLIEEATSIVHLAQCYVGWCGFW